MAWSTPRTWVTGELITSALLNQHLRDQLIYLKDPPTGSYITNEASDYSTTSTSFVDVDATNLAATIVTAGGDVMIGFFGSARNNNAAGTVHFDVLVDGTRLGGDDGLVMFINPDAAAQSRDVIPSFVALARGLGAGSHTFKLQWKVSAGTGFLLAGAGTAGGRDVHSGFWVREVS